MLNGVVHQCKITSIYNSNRYIWFANWYYIYTQPTRR